RLRVSPPPPPRPSTPPPRLPRRAAPPPRRSAAAAGGGPVWRATGRASSPADPARSSAHRPHVPPGGNAAERDRRTYQHRGDPIRHRRHGVHARTLECPPRAVPPLRVSASAAARPNLHPCTARRVQAGREIMSE